MLLMVVASILSFMCLPVPAEVTNVFRQQMSDGRYICGSIDVRNSVKSLNQLRNCSVVEGFVQIVLIENARNEDYVSISFPELVEITSYLLVFRVHGLTSLGGLFPNLAVIRGQPPFYNYAFVIHNVPDLTEIGLWSLSKIMRGSVHIVGNPNLCYVHTVNWTSLVSHGSNMIANNGNNCSSQTCGKSCPNCWGEGWLQKCGKRKQEAAKCDRLCLGGCKEDKPDHCNSCAGVFTDDICSEACPHGRYEFLSRRCVTDTECQEMAERHLTAPDPDLEDLGQHIDSVWWPHNSSCDQSCLTSTEKSRTAVKNLSCKKCQGGKCHRKCSGIAVSNTSSAKLLKGCTYIAGSLEIQIQGIPHVDELQEYLNSIEEIEGYLKVSRSFPLLNLNFLQQLQVIHGKTLDQGKYALIVMENNNLEDLWNWSSRSYGLKIRNGSLFFHFNPKLCLSKIDKLREISGAPNFSNSEVARESNGDKMACEIKKIKSYVKTKASRGVVIEWEPFTDVPKEKLLGYIVYYIEAPSNINITLYDGRDPCKSYGWRAIDVTTDDEKPNQLLAQLKPFTQYAFYVETYSVTNKGGRSELQYFTTLPDRPSLPTKVLSFSNSSSEIILTWEPPIHPNGILTHYIVTGEWQRDTQKYLDYIDHCTYKIKRESEVGLVPSDGKFENQTSSCCIDIPVKFEISDKVVFEHMCQSKQLLHSKYTEKLHVSNEVDACYNYLHTYMHEGLRLNKTRQEFQMIRVGENEWQGYPPHISDVNSQNSGFPNSAENYTAVDNGVFKNFTYLVDAKQNTFILRNLHHFALYTISLYACRKPLYYIDENEKNVSDYNFCSYASIVSVRTLADPTLDEIYFKKMAVDSFNHSLSEVYVSWKEPKRPNGVIVAYEVEYRMVDVENFAPSKVCITRKQHERNGGGTVVGNLSLGNYGFRVRAISLAGEGTFTEMKYFWVGEKPGALSLTEILILVFVCLVTFLLATLALYLKTNKFNMSPPPLVASVNPDYVSTNGYKFFDDEWEIQRDNVTLLRELGQGFFGTVYEGRMNPGEVHCAVKTVSVSATRRQMMEFLNEASVMKLFSDAHHVVKLLGVVSKVFPPLVIMELMINGDLKSYLRAARDDHILGQPNLQRILLMAAQIADGMAYLGDNKFVHRDLAARNCMVAEDLTVKIGDFGMTRDIYETDYYRNDTKGLLPVRWMAPESLADGVFTSQSDVWSYGVVLWEMATLAEQPYQGMSNELVLQHVLAGGCLESPILCPDILRQLMESCWHSKPSKRLTFFDIIAKMEEVTELGAVFRERSYYCRREIPNEKFACDSQQDEPKSVEASTSRPNVTFYHSNNSGDIVAQWKQHSIAPEAQPLLLPTDQNYVEHESQQRNSVNRIQPKVGEKNYVEKVTNGTAGGCILPFKSYCENKK